MPVPPSVHGQDEEPVPVPAGDQIGAIRTSEDRLEDSRVRDDPVQVFLIVLYCRVLGTLSLTCLGHLVAVVRGDSNIKGTVVFEQESESSPTTITWDITGHDPSAKRGMHIHTFGDNTNGCTSAGPHCEQSLATAHHKFRDN